MINLVINVYDNKDGTYQSVPISLYLHRLLFMIFKLCLLINVSVQTKGWIIVIWYLLSALNTLFTEYVVNIIIIIINTSVYFITHQILFI